MSDQTTHPSPEELSAFNLGQLPPETAAAVEDHISDCETCCETLLGLGSHDTFVDLLKEARRSSNDESANPTFVTGEIPQRKAGGSTIPETLTEHTRYEIVRLIGKGGMGDVFEARHRMMDRTVALKVINHEFIRKPQAVDRFHREVKAAARLSHPNIVTAYDAEQAGDLHFLVMEYVDGVDLANFVKDRGSLPVSEACEFARQAAIGLQHAHEQGMVHRDIKPHNLMVTADGTVKILDFGLASLAPEALPEEEGKDLPGELTAAGAIIGTPDFISPEQAQDAHQADIRSDIYSLGATLYYLLSGRAPFADASVIEKLKHHAEQEPVPLENLQIEIPDELAAVMRKMIAKDPAERYQTPQEVADALDRVSAQLRSASGTHPPHDGTADGLADVSEHRQNIKSLADLFLAVALLNTAWIVIVFYNIDAIARSSIADTFGVPLFYASLVGIPLSTMLGFAAWRMRRFQSYRWSTAAAILAMIPVTPVNIVLGFVCGLWAALLLLKPEVRRLFENHEGNGGAGASLTERPRSAEPRSDHAGAGRIPRWVAGVAFFGFAAILAGVFYIQLGKTTLKFEVLDPAVEVRFAGESVVFRDQNGADSTFTVKPGTRQEFVVQQNGAIVETDSLVLNRGDRVVLRVDVVDGKVKIAANKDVTVDRQPHDTVEPGRYARDAGESDSSAKIDEVGRFDEHDGYVYQAIVTPDGEYGISCGSDKTIRIWDLETQRETQILKGHQDAVYGLAISADGRILASGDKANTIRLWDLGSAKSLGELHGHEGPVTDLAFLTDGRLLSAGFDETLRIWDVHEQKLVRTIDLGAKVEKMEPLWDNRRVMLSGAHTGGWGVVNYDLEKGEKLDPQASAQSCLAVASDRRTTLVGTITGVLRVENMESGKLLVQMADPRAKAARDAAILPGGRFAVTTTREGQMHLWNLEEGRLMTTVASDSIGTVTLSADGRHALTVGREGGVSVWRLPESAWPGARQTRNIQVIKETMLKFVGHETVVHCVRFSHDGRYLLTSSGAHIGDSVYDCTLRLWDASTGQEIRQFTDHTDMVFACDFSPDGRRVISGSRDGTIRVWDIETGEELQQLEGHTAWVSFVGYTPDGNYIISGSGGGDIPREERDVTLRVWDAAGGNEMHTLYTGPWGRLKAVALFPDSRRVIVSGPDTEGTLRIYNLQTRQLINSLHGHNRPITSVAVSPNGKYVVASFKPNLKQFSDQDFLHDPENGVLYMWDVATGEVVQEFHGHSGAVETVAFSDEGRLIVSGSGGMYRNSTSFIQSDDNTVRVWNVETGREVCRYTGHRRTLQSAVFSPDGKSVVSAGYGSEVHLWRLPAEILSKSVRSDSAKPTAAGETRDKFQEMIEAARAAQTGDEMQAVVSGYTPMLALLSQTAGSNLIELLAELPDDMHRTLLQDGYLKWKAGELDPDRRQTMLDLFAALLAQNPQNAKKLEQIDAYAAVSDAGFAVIGLPESNSQVLVWYFLRRDVRFPTVLLLMGSTSTALKDALKPDNHQQIDKKVTDLIDKPYTGLPSAPAALPETVAELKALIENIPADDSEEDWKAFLERHVPPLKEFPDEFTRKLLQLIAGLPESTRHELLDRGYLKWRFRELDDERRELNRQLLTGMLAAAQGTGAGLENATIGKMVEKMETTGDVGFAVVDVPTTHAQVIVWYVHSPNAPIPIMVPVSGVKSQTQNKVLSRSVYDQLSSLEDKPHTDLPPAPAASRKIRESLQALLNNLPEDEVTDEEWNKYLSEHAPFLADTRAPERIARDLIALLDGLPEESLDSLLDEGFVKWPFSKLDNARQDKIRSVMKGVMSSVPEEQRDDKVTDLILNSLVTADVGFAVLKLPDSHKQFIALFAQMPASFSPTILPIVGDVKDDFKSINAPAVQKQTEDILKQPDSELPAEETIRSNFQLNDQDLSAFDPAADYPTLAPFDALRWEDSRLHARVLGTWYELQEIDGVPVESILAACRRIDEEIWLERFAEDLVQVMSLMGHRPGRTVDLKVISQEGKSILLEDIPMTDENRDALRKATLTPPDDAVERSKSILPEEKLSRKDKQATIIIITEPKSSLPFDWKVGETVTVGVRCVSDDGVRVIGIACDVELVAAKDFDNRVQLALRSTPEAIEKIREAARISEYWFHIMPFREAHRETLKNDVDLSDFLKKESEFRPAGPDEWGWGAPDGRLEPPAAEELPNRKSCEAAESVAPDNTTKQ